MPVEVAGALGDVAIRPEVSSAGRAVAGNEVVDWGFVDLEFLGLEDFLADGLADGNEVAGGGGGPGVEGLPPDVDVVPSSEALGLAVVGKVVLVFVGDDLGGERGCEQGAGDAGKWGGCDDGRAGFFGFVDEFFANGAPPEDLGVGDVEFVVVFFADLLPGVRIGEDFIRDDFLFDKDHEVLGETLSFGAAVFWDAWLFILQHVRRSLGVGGCGCFVACFRKRLGLSQQDFVEEELKLSGIELLAAGTEKPLLEIGDDLVFAGEFGSEEGVFGLKANEPFFKLVDTKEQGIEIGWSAFFH